MPLTEKGSEILSNMEKEYGKEKGERVFYASRNTGTISGVDAVTGLSAQEKLFGMQRPMTGDAESVAEDCSNVSSAADTMAQQLGSMGADVKRLIEKATRSDQKDKEIHSGPKDS